MEVRMRKRYLSLVCVLALLLSVFGMNVRAADQNVMIDGSYLTQDEESIGEAILIMRGEDLQTGSSKITKASSTAINAGGTTTARHTVDEIGIAVVIERLKVGTSTWSYYKTWTVEKTNASSVSTSKKYTVPKGYYYRVRSTHWANSDASSSFTDGILIN